MIAKICKNYSTMIKVTVKQFQDAMTIVKTYCAQIQPSPDLQAHEVGCRVKLSPYGLETQGNYRHQGTVMDYFPWQGRTTDGIVTVLWDDRKVPQDMHITQVEPIKK